MARVGIVLIRGATLRDGRATDLRLADGLIYAMGRLDPLPGEPLIDARGGLLLPGLHDHHLHVAALAASLHSVPCGPPQVLTQQDLAATLGKPGTGWLRGIGYHESVAGLPDAAALDRLQSDRPVRLQHRSGRMWLFNTAGLATLLEARDPPVGLEREGGRFTGRLFDSDGWLRQALGNQPPSFAETGRLLAGNGVTGITEMSPANDDVMARHFAAEHQKGALPQTTLLGGSLSLGARDMAPGLTLGPAKLHLHEADLPSLENAVAFACSAHDRERPVAVHCVSEVELLFTLAMFEEAGIRRGDRIEHAGIATDGMIADIARLGLAVVTQPHFIAERGDAYARDVPTDQHGTLYRLRSFRDAGIPLAAGSDAPFGRPDPWASMRAAISRRGESGKSIGPGEALSPEEALDLYLRDPKDLSLTRCLEPGAAGDLCLLDRAWPAAREMLSAEMVRATFIAGKLIYDCVDQPPA